MLPLWARVDLGVMAIMGYLAFPQSTSITWASPSDCLVSYPEHSLGESYSSAEMQSVYSTVDWTRCVCTLRYIYVLLLIYLHEFISKYTQKYVYIL